MAVRKAEELSSLEELGLSFRVQIYVARKTSSVQDAVLRGRYLYLAHRECPSLPELSRKSDIKLVSALNSAGFIRRDIASNSFRVNCLYKAVYPEIDCSLSMPCSIGDLCRPVRGVREANRRYEAFNNPSVEQIELIEEALSKHLSRNECLVIEGLFGLYDGKMRTLARVGEDMGLSRQRVQQIKEKAIKKLKEGKVLPPL